jgi:FKBP-type peptidyl-prolyl cis-trans isomerase SlyD
MKIEPQHVVSLTYDLYVNNDQGTEELVESATEEQPLNFFIWRRTNAAKI